MRPPILCAITSTWGTGAPLLYWMEFRNTPRSVPSCSIAQFGHSVQFSKKYTTGAKFGEPVAIEA